MQLNTNNLLKGKYMDTLYFIDFRGNWESGIEKKISKQCEVMSRSIGRCERINISRNLSPILRKMLYMLPFLTPYDYKKILKILPMQGCYIRYNKIDFRGILAIRKIHKKKCKIVIEIPTFPYDNELTGITRILYYKDYISRNLLKKYVNRIVTFSDDNTIFCVPTICISNAADIESISLSNKQINTEEIQLIAVASLQFWHGYDRVIEGMGKYYQNGGLAKIIFHIVGDGDQLNYYKQLIKKYRLQDKVFLHGRKTGTALDQIYDLADIAIDSMGRHRSGVFYNSSLKGKEYLAKGLPVISGVKTELDSYPDFPYYLRIPADDSILDIDSLIRFYKKIYIGVSRNEVQNQIRSFCEKNFSFQACYDKVIQFFKDDDTL